MGYVFELYLFPKTVRSIEKIKLAQKRVLDINPDCRVDIHSSFVNPETLPSLLSYDLNVVIDAIDGLNSKVNLIVEARKMGIEVISSMGAAGRTDLSMICTGDISKSSVCPLARVVRQRLHRRGVHEGVHAVWSTEKPLNKAIRNKTFSEPPLTAFGRYRPSLGSIAWVPGVFGLHLAAKAVSLIIK